MIDTAPMLFDGITAVMYNCKDKSYGTKNMVHRFSEKIIKYFLML